MSFDGERQAFEARLAANFSATSIQYENAPFNPPSNAAYISAKILAGEGIIASLGPSPLHRFPGVFHIDLYAPEDQGTKVLRDHADTIESAFRNVQFSAGGSGTITTGTPTYIGIGIEDGWYHAVLSIPYSRDKIY